MTFTNAPVTQLAVLGLVSGSVLTSLSDVKHYFYILIDTHLWRYRQLWRLLAYQLCYVNSAEVLFAAMSVYNLRPVERMWGSRKYASFLVVSYLLAALLCPLVMVVLRPVSVDLFNYVPPGPTPVIFAVLAQFYAMVPHTYKFRVATSHDASSGLTLSDKSYQYLVAFHLSLLQWPGSIVGAIVGWLIGHAWRGGVLPASLVTWRLPGWMVGTGTQGGGSAEFEGLRRRLEGEERAVSTAIQGQPGGSQVDRRRPRGGRSGG
ncbi:UBA domain-containing protein Ucp14 [Ophiocordyceps camponoti-floridani]|uniref:UBA domain-containing protein Ucp14 n=1 Tax=Ophiocordyceps camponoti-floridani TaxID=2030778 RepID=A0A8H4Q988_9HYPO|nr:UBA domain-containing protein Ucp14 [Ophiocordyceps camponoti-floridani]